jgi:hypothetical protein
MMALRKLVTGVLGCLAAGAALLPCGSAEAQVVMEQTTYIPGFNIYGWVSLSDPRQAVYTAAPFAASVPYQCQHVGRVYADQQVAEDSTFYVAGTIGDVWPGNPPTWNNINTVTAYIVFLEDDPPQTKQTPVLINSPGNQTRVVGSYRAYGDTNVIYQLVSRVLPLVVFDYQVQWP